MALGKKISEHGALQIEWIGKPPYAVSYVDKPSRTSSIYATEEPLLHITADGT
jgi:hypothetical protein